MHSTNQSPERTALYDLYADLLALGCRLKQETELGSLERLRTYLEEKIHEAAQRGLDQGTAREDLDAARYAVAAFLDEMITSSPWPHKDAWASQSLQYRLFGTNVAGEEFFSRLESLRSAIPPNPDVLEVYHLCLALGFEGQYRLNGSKPLQNLMNDLFWEIQGRRGEMPSLSPPLSQQDEPIVLIDNMISWRAVMTTIGITLVFFFVCTWWANDQMGEKIKSVKEQISLMA